MPGEYDVMICPSILNHKMISLGGSVSARYVQTITLPATGNTQNQTFNWSYTIDKRTQGSTLFASIRKGGGYNVAGNNRFQWHRVNMIRNVSFSGSVMNVTVYSDCWDGPGIDNSGIIDVYEILNDKSMPATGYGITVRNSVDWTSFTSSDQICALAYKQTITLTTSGWSFPSNLANKQVLLFADWSSPGAVVAYSASSKKVTLSGISSLEITLYIFAIGPDLVRPNYGIVIYNKAGQMTFSSENPPITSPNTSLTLNGANKNLPFPNTLLQLTDFGYSVRTTSNEFWVYSVGVIKDGNKARLTLAQLLNNFNAKILQSDPIYANLNVLTLNKDIYE